MYLSEEEMSSVRSLIKARDDARRRRKYDVSDRLRDELKEAYGIFIDDRLKMWWTAVDGSKVPQSIHEIKGDGRWKQKPWRQVGDIFSVLFCRCTAVIASVPSALSFVGVFLDIYISPFFFLLTK